MTWKQDFGENVSSEFTVKGNQIFYKGKVLIEKLPEECLDHTNILACRFVSDSANLLDVMVRYTETPAPYTPYVRYVFLETNETVKKMPQWNELDRPGKLYETQNAYYVCSDARNVVSRFYTICTVNMEAWKPSALLMTNSMYGRLISAMRKINSGWIGMAVG